VLKVLAMRRQKNIAKVAIVTGEETIVKLSVLDQCPVPRGSSPGDGFAGQLGYARYWVAEHHAMAGLASPAPEILMAMAAPQLLPSALDRWESS